MFGFTAALDRHGGSTRPFEHALGYHLCKVFLKLGLSSRAELARLTLDEVEASA